MRVTLLITGIAILGYVYIDQVAHDNAHLFDTRILFEERIDAS